MVRLLPIAHVAQLAGLRRHTIKEIDQLRVEARHGQFVGRGARHLVMDKFALHKGHRYATVVVDAETMRLIWVGEGHSREAICPFSNDSARKAAARSRQSPWT